MNEEIAESYRIRTTLVDFLLGLVAPRVGVFVTELGQQTHCVLYFLVVYFLVFIFVTPILNISRKFSMCIIFSTRYIKIYNINSKNEYFIQQHAFV